MRVTVIASGSKGNATLIETEKHNILIDAGLGYLTVRKRLNKTLPEIDIILITHVHDDHIKGLTSFIKRYKPLIYTKSPEIFEKTLYDNIYIEDNYLDENLEIDFFPLSHDTTCYGIKVKENNKELVYITDTGFIHEKVIKKIKNKDFYILESNHDEEMLRNSRYPFYLQQRIRGDKGHLSNEMAASYIKKIIGNNTSYLVLAHLSEENNNPGIALKNAINALEETDSKLKGLFIAKQDEPLESIEV